MQDALDPRKTASALKTRFQPADHQENRVKKQSCFLCIWGRKLGLYIFDKKQRGIGLVNGKQHATRMEIK
jgi:hypothetical protein